MIIIYQITKYRFIYLLSILYLLGSITLSLGVADISIPSDISVSEYSSIKKPDPYENWEWSQMSIVTPDDGNSSNERYADITVDKGGIIHVLWVENDTQLMYSNLDPISYAMDNKTALSVKNNNTNISGQILSDEKGNLHVIWSERSELLGTPFIDKVFYRVLGSNNDTWSAIEWVTFDFDNYAFNPSMDIDPETNIVHVAYIAQGAIGYKQRDRTGTWIDHQEFKPGLVPYTVNFKLDSKKNLHFYWQTIGIQRTYYQVYNSEFKEIIPANNVDNVVNLLDFPSISIVKAMALDSKGQAHFVWLQWLDGQPPQYQYTYFDKNTLTIANPIQLPVFTNAQIWSPTIAIDEFDNIHVVAMENSDILDSGGDTDILYLRKQSHQNWNQTTATIVSSTNGDSVNPKVLIGQDGFLHVIWGDFSDYRNQEEDADLLIRTLYGYPESPKLKIFEIPSKLNTVQLDWDAVFSAGSYKIFRSREPFYETTDLIPIHVQAHTDYIDQVDQSGTYYYAVVASNRLGESKPTFTSGVVVSLDTSSKEYVTSTTTITEVSDNGALSLNGIAFFVVLMLIPLIKKKKSSRQ